MFYLDTIRNVSSNNVSELISIYRSKLVLIIKNIRRVSPLLAKPSQSANISPPYFWTATITLYNNETYSTVYIDVIYYEIILPEESLMIHG